MSALRWKLYWAFEKEMHQMRQTKGLLILSLHYVKVFTLSVSPNGLTPLPKGEAMSLGEEIGIDFVSF